MLKKNDDERKFVELLNSRERFSDNGLWKNQSKDDNVMRYDNTIKGSKKWLMGKKGSMVGLTEKGEVMSERTNKRVFRTKVFF